MDKRKPQAEHEKLHQLAGTWVGEEKMYASPMTKEGLARGRFDMRVGMDGFFLVSDYVEEVDGKPFLYGLGVFGWDEREKCYTMHWFDNFGSVPGQPGRGQWEGDTLRIEHVRGPSKSRTSFTLDGEHLRFRAEHQVQGQWQPLVEGTYRRS